MSLDYAVVATDRTLKKRHTLRRFPTEDQAIAHALNADMRYWDDVWVEPCAAPVPQPEWTPPKLPFSILWQCGYAYLTDADGRKLATILGNQKQREWLAEKLIEANLIEADK